MMSSSRITRTSSPFSRTVCPGIFSEQHAVADFHVNWDQLAVIGELALADRHDLPLVGLLRRGVGDDDARGGLLLLVETLDDYAIVQWTDFHRDSFEGCGRRREGGPRCSDCSMAANSCA